MPGVKVGLLDKLKSDAAGMVILGLLTLARGVSYLPPLKNQSSTSAHALEGIFPPMVWGAIWILIGLACLVAALLPKAVPLVFGAGVGLHAAWAFSFLGETFIGDSARGYVSAISYIGLALLAIWGMSRATHKVEVTLKE